MGQWAFAHGGDFRVSPMRKGLETTQCETPQQPYEVLYAGLGGSLSGGPEERGKEAILLRFSHVRV